MKFPIFLLTAYLLLSSCLSSPDNPASSAEEANIFLDDTSSTQFFAVISTVEPSFSGGAHSILELSGERRAQNNLRPTASSDLYITGRGSYFYRLEKFNADNVSKFSIASPGGSPVWQYSTMDANDTAEGITSSNPYSMIFVSDTKAYILRYGSKRAWIVNPSASTEAGFKTGELDLSAYADADGLPEMSYGVIVNNKLYILMQRLEFWQATAAPYIAVFDTNTDTEIDTDPLNPGLYGIELDVRNPSSKIIYNDGNIYAAGAPDSLFMSGIPAGQGAGLQKIDVNTYQTSPLLYDGHNITGMAVSSEQQVYLIEYSGWNDVEIKEFNSVTGAVRAGNVAGIGDTADRNISDIAISTDGKLWVADSSLTDQGIYVIDPENNMLEDGPISTDLNPINISFCSYSR